MTEQEWLKVTEPTPDVLQWAKDNGLSERKARLFACACVRKVWHLLEDPRSRMAIEVAERLADGVATHETLQEARAAAWDAAWGVSRDAARYAAWDTVRHSAWDAAWDAARDAARHSAWDAAWSAPWSAAWAAELNHQVSILRDILGNPFRTTAVSGRPYWAVAPHIQELAQAAYRPINDMGYLDNAVLAILSDALEEAGCDNADVLEHLRSPGPHYRGCWSLDVVLGKE
jgi:hypothetical protein